jgi:hypothetical protein
MHNRSFWGPLFALLVLLGSAAFLGALAYNAGVAHGVAEATRLAAAPVESGSRVYVWPGPWHGYGFGFFPIFPFVVFFVVIAFVRGMLWRRRWYGGGYGPGRCGSGHDGVPPMFEEWHRRAHERQGAPQTPPEKTA